MPLPIAHALVGATVVAALRPSSKFAGLTPVLIGAFLGVFPDFDYALNWFRISGGGWHHGFTHSTAFALLLGLVSLTSLKRWSAKWFGVFSAAALSHTLLDYLITESQGVALWWPLTDYRYKLRFPNPIDYTWSDDSLSDVLSGVLKASLTEVLIFAPIFLAVILVRARVKRRAEAS